MDNFTLLIVCTSLYLLVCTGIGIYSSRIKVTKASDFFLAGHSLGPIVLSLTMMATVFSAWFILGHQGLTWQLGFSSDGEAGIVYFWPSMGDQSQK